MQQSNVKLIVAYDGTNYLGWQKTLFGKSIEAVLQSVIEQILQKPVQLQAASRTDAGVHARGQVVNFCISTPLPDLARFHLSLNALLPRDIIVVSVALAPQSFHPTLDSIGKEYHYYVCNTPFQYPEHRHYSWHVYHSLNYRHIEEAAGLLVGEHDFSAFCNAKKNEEYANHVRRLDCIEIHALPDNRFYIKIAGNHFLYKMARNIAGTLIDIGKGRLTVDSIHRLFAMHDRTLAGVTAPAHGLTLFQVFYPSYDVVL